jgi:hypothetical protein
VTEAAPVPKAFALLQCYPNPFNPTTMIAFDVPERASITLKVYDLLGREVATILRNSFFEPGSHTVTFDGSRLASGVYFYSLKGEASGRGTFVAVRKMLLLK